jgi:BirA family biotin operon repressor/biotin-[acetyl-CoA-carboxylase] ligase
VSFSQVQHLVRLLSTAESRSVAFLAHELGCSRAMVLKHIRELGDLGLDIESLADETFLISEPLELLDKDLILSMMNGEKRRTLTGLKIETTLDSTNLALHRQPLSRQHANVILAEHQSSGRGRRGRHWVSPFAQNLYLSLGWKFENPMSELTCLPLVVALAAAKALTRAGLQGHRVKWPNDLLLDGRKLGGCLLEIQGDNHGPCHAVLGVGINVRMPISDKTADIDQAWTDLNSHLPAFSRNALAALVLENLLSHLSLFAVQGFGPFRPHWQQVDGLFGQTISVYSGNSTMQGTAVGIDQNGALLLDTGKETLILHSGEASLHKTSL